MAISRTKKRPGKVRPTTAKELSVLAWIQDAQGNVLLIQQTAGEQLWSLPGGKANSTEALKVALRRELKEEIGVNLSSARVIDLFDRPMRSSLAVLFRTTLGKGKLKLGKTEIKNAAFVNKLPPNATPSLRFFWKRQFSQAQAKSNTLDL